MAETLISPGVLARENDFSQVTQQPVTVGAAIVGPTVKGPVNIPTIVLAGNEYGSGSSRDWAAKGPYLQGIKAVIAQSYERIHRSNLVGMGILPLQFKAGESADAHGLTGKEQFNIDTQGGQLKVGQDVVVTTNCGKKFTVTCRLDTDPEIAYYQNGGIL